MVERKEKNKKSHIFSQRNLSTELQVPIFLGSFKSTVSQEGLNILITTFCVDGFQALSTAFHYPYTIINSLYASVKLVNN